MIKKLLFFAMVATFCLIDSQAQSGAGDSGRSGNQFTRPAPGLGILQPSLGEDYIAGGLGAFQAY